MKTAAVSSVLIMMTVSLIAGEITDIREYPCYQFMEEPTLDGRIDEVVWQKIPEATGFFALGGKIYSLERQSSFKAGWTTNALYVAVKCYEPAPVKIKAQPKDGDSLWGDDSVELFFSPRPASDSFFQFAVNPLGARWSGPAVQKPERWQAKGSTNSAGWCVEVRIPFDVLQKTPLSNEVWRFNICRNSKNEAKSEPSTCWSKLNKSFHEAQKFARLVFKVGLPAEHARKETEEQMADFCRQDLENQLTDIVKSAAEYKAYIVKAAQYPKLQKDLASIKESLAMVEQAAANKSRSLYEMSDVIEKYRNMDEKTETLKWKIQMEDLLAGMNK